MTTRRTSIAEELPLPLEEFAARLAVARDPREAEETLALWRWFTARYKTPRERLRYIRRKAAEAARLPRIGP